MQKHDKDWQTQYCNLGGVVKTAPDGRWFAEHRNIKQKRVRFYVNSKDKLVKRLASVVNNHLKGIDIMYSDEQNATLTKALLMLETKVKEEIFSGSNIRCNPKTLQRKLNDITKLLKFLELSESLTNKYVRNYDWTDADNLVTIIDKGCGKESPHTRSRYFSLCQDAFDDCILKGFVSSNVNVLTEYRQAKSNKKFTRSFNKRKQDIKELMRRWDISDMKRFIDSIKDPVEKRIARLMAYTGMRVSEIMALRKSDLKIKSNESSYVEVVGQLDNQGKWKKGTKTDAGFLRQVDIGQGLATDLKDYIDNFLYKFKDNSELVGYDDGEPVYGGDLLFPYVRNHYADGYSYMTLVKRFKKHFKGEFTLPDQLKFHFFRHWLITMWARHDIYNVNQAVSMVGHETIQTTQNIYTSISNTRHYEKIDSKYDWIDNKLF